MGDKGRVDYPSDVTDEEWAFVLPYLLLCREDSPQRKHDLRTVFNAVRYVARTGGQWRFLPHDLLPWYVVYQQMQRWLRAGCFELLVEDVRSLLREWGGRKGQPTAVVIDSRTLQSTPESGARAGYDGAKRRKASKVHIAVDTLRHLLALTVTPADQGDREQVAAQDAAVRIAKADRQGTFPEAHQGGRADDQWFAPDPIDEKKRSDGGQEVDGAERDTCAKRCLRAVWEDRLFEDYGTAKEHRVDARYLLKDRDADSNDQRTPTRRSSASEPMASFSQRTATPRPSNCSISLGNIERSICLWCHRAGLVLVEGDRSLR